MWARVAETMIGLWLLMSPFIFEHPKSAWLLWTTDLGAGAAVIILALASYWDPLRHAHLAILIVAAWLLGFGRFYETTPSPALQNDILVGLVLMLVAIIPNNASEPPRSWQQWYEKREE